jgi:pyruvate formate lyase activating enzyme
MDIGGIQKISLSDYPGEICAIVFTQGCNFRCPYCHNPELVDPARFSPRVDEAAVLAFLKARRGKIPAVTLTGGEPTLQPDLEGFLAAVRSMGFLIKLDTNGSRPEVLEPLIRQGMVDYLAMDLKGPLSQYERVVGAKVRAADIGRSIVLIRDSGIEHEFRTTVVRSLLTPAEVLETARLVSPADRYVLQAHVPSKALDSAFLSEQAYPEDEMAAVRQALINEARWILVR